MFCLIIKDDRYECCKKFGGIRMNHCFKPITINTFLMKITSNDDNVINLFDASIELDFNLLMLMVHWNGNR